MVRARNGVLNMVGEGSGAVSVAFNNRYPEITVDDTSLSLMRNPGADPSDSNTIGLPQRFTYTSAANMDGRSLCLEKNGMHVHISEGSCSTPPSCGNEHACSYQPARQDGGSSVETPAWGYWCDNSVFTDERFHQHYYSSGQCAGRGVASTFVDINRFSCPDAAIQTLRVGCMVAASWRCPAGGTARLELSLPDRTESRTVDCTGEVQHARLAGVFTPSAAGDVTVSASVDHSAASTSLERTVSVETARETIEERSQEERGVS